MNSKIIEQHGYELLDLVEETSKTVVCKALQKTLARVVILRILKQEAACRASEVEHFLSTARRIARIKSDSIASIFDIVSEGDFHYVAMEYVEGPSLEELVAASGPLPVEQVLRIAASLVTSLEQMWNASHIVHRNLKSSIIRLDPRGVAKITDFSLAIVAGPGIDATAMDEGHIVGTPCFLSPEQAQGSHTLNTQSDMYALGAVLYHLATGVVPFEGQDAVSILGAHVKQQIPPPHHLNPAIPVFFSWFIHRLMMKNPNNRYASWGDALQDIRFQLAGTPPSCVRPDDEYLSTIASIIDTDNGGAHTKGEQAPARLRLSKKERKRRIAAKRAERVQDEAPEETIAVRKGMATRQEAFWWSLLAVWLIALFWFRAVYQQDPPRKVQAVQATQTAEAAAPTLVPSENIQAQPEEREPPPSPAPGMPSAAQPPAPPPPETPAPLPSRNPPPDVSQKPAGTPPAAAPATPAPDAPLPSGIPASLKSGLARALANADLAAARQLVHADSARFQEKGALETLLSQVPEADTLVAEYLQTQIGKPLIFEHSGKQRTVIPRGIENGVIHIEVNGRGAEFQISKLTPDEKLRWMGKPQDAAQSAAYCLTLMRSARRAEISAHAEGCPLLAPVLIEAAGLVPATTTPAE